MEDTGDTLAMEEAEEQQFQIYEPRPNDSQEQPAVMLNSPPKDCDDADDDMNDDPKECDNNEEPQKVGF